jgi:hypothetical protein
MEEIIAERIRQFEITYGIQPNGILINHKTYTDMVNNEYTAFLSFNGIPMYRTVDLPENEIKFIL